MRRTPNKFSSELRERSLRLVLDSEGQRFRDADAGVAHSAVHLWMLRQKLNRPKGAGLPGDLRHPVWRTECVPQALGSRPTEVTHPLTIRASCRVERCRLPQTRLGRRCLRQLVAGSLYPAFQGQAGGFGECKADRPARLALDHRGALLYAAGGEYIPDEKTDEITAAQPAVDGHSEQGEAALVACHRQADPDGQDMPRQKRASCPTRQPLFQATRAGPGAGSRRMMLACPDCRRHALANPNNPCGASDPHRRGPPFRSPERRERLYPCPRHGFDSQQGGMMFNTWQQEKATAALVGDAQAVADRLATAKRHVVDSFAATAWFWAASLQAEGQDPYAIASWPPAAVTRFLTATQTRIAALRKTRDYDLSDGLSVWLHTARAVTEPRIARPVQDIWQMILGAGPNADTMATDLMAEAGLPAVLVRQAPTGIAPESVHGD